MGSDFPVEAAALTEMFLLLEVVIFSLVTVSSRYWKSFTEKAESCDEVQTEAVNIHFLLFNSF